MNWYELTWTDANWRELTWTDCNAKNPKPKPNSNCHAGAHKDFFENRQCKETQAQIQFQLPPRSSQRLLWTSATQRTPSANQIQIVTQEFPKTSLKICNANNPSPNRIEIVTRSFIKPGLQIMIVNLPLLKRRGAGGRCTTLNPKILLWVGGGGHHATPPAPPYPSRGGGRKRGWRENPKP